jgi:protein involved in polysaccharide export with SLBB domain
VTRLILLLVAAAVAVGCTAGDPATVDTTQPSTTTTEAPTTTTEPGTTTTQTATTTTEAEAADEADSPGSEQVGVGDKVTITILDEDGNVVGP